MDLTNIHWVFYSPRGKKKVFKTGSNYNFDAKPKGEHIPQVNISKRVNFNLWKKKHI